MSATAVRLEQFRLDRGTMSAGCLSCPLLAQCGGYTRAGGGWSCMDRCASCNSSCDLVCLKKPGDFARALLEVGGFGHESTPPLISHRDALPRYIPVFQHGVVQAVSLPWAAVPLRALMRQRGGPYQPVVPTAIGLREHLGVAPNTRLLLLGTGKDRGIESYWRWRRIHNTPAKLASLDFSAGVAPNYSLFLEDPRPQHLFNRKRSLLSASEWSAAGIPAIPYLQAVSAADWSYWESLLRSHPEITHVAKEFRTGNAHPERGQQAIEELTRLQDLIGRRLHVVAIGAARFRDLLSKRFDSWTILDSVPFMKSVKRRAAGRFDDRRIRWLAARGRDVSELLLHNLAQYERWLSTSSA